MTINRLERNKFKKSGSMRDNVIMDGKSTSEGVRVECRPVAFEFDVHITGEIGEPENYRDVIAALNEAKEEDTVNFIINSGGGLDSTATEIVAAMGSTEAKTCATIAGDCCSAATLLFLMADDVSIGEDVCFMVHNATYGSYGKAEDVKSRVEFIDKQCRSLMHRYYKGFMSEEEIEQAISGKEFWMDRDEVILRLKRRSELFAKEQDEVKEE